jgi:RNA polymerase sigma-70 factor (ECF subfamily)
MTGNEPLQTARPADEVLVEQVLCGDTKAFEALMRKHNQRLFRTGMAILRNETDVEDAMQTAYINAYLHLARFERRSAFSTWLTRIMLNQCLEQKRKNTLAKSRVEAPQTLLHMQTPDHELGNKELTRLLEAAVGQLPEKYRLVFVLREVEELSVKETSEVLSIEPSNVKTRLNRAKSMLRGQLQGYMKDHVYSFHLSRCDRVVSAVLAAVKNHKE